MNKKINYQVPESEDLPVRMELSVLSGIQIGTTAGLYEDEDWY
jgi:hypothetical protein